MLTNNIARKTRINIVPFKATNHDSVDPNERLFEYSDWGPAWATFEQLRDWSWKKASWHLKGLVPAQDFEVYRDALNIGYARVWTILLENPSFCAGKPYNYIGITAGYKAANHIISDIRHERRTASFDCLLDPGRRDDNGDVFDVVDIEQMAQSMSLHNMRLHGEVHAAFERYVDMRLDFDQIIDCIIEQMRSDHKRCDGIKPREIRIALWAMSEGIGRKELAQITNGSAHRWHSITDNIRRVIAETGILDEWKPMTLHEAIQRDPQPLQRLADEFAAADDINSLLVLYDIITDVRQRDLYPHTTYTHKDIKTTFVHLKRKVQWRLLQVYRIYNVEY